MRRAAHVTSVDALRRFKAAMLEFIDEGRRAMAEVDSEVQRALVWVEVDRMGHWKREIRKRQEKVAQAKSDLYRAQLQAQGDDRRPDCIDEHKALGRAEERLKEAEQKLENTRRWARQLQRELILYKGQSQAFQSALYGELPRAVTKLDQLLERLESYLAERGVAPIEAVTTEPESRPSAPTMARPAGPDRIKPQSEDGGHDERERRKDEAEERAEDAESEVESDAR